MRYMRGLNEWLERDVHDRQSELRGVVARVDQLRDDIRNVRMQGIPHFSGLLAKTFELTRACLSRTTGRE